MTIRENKWLNRFVTSVLHKKTTEVYETPVVTVPVSWEELKNSIIRYGATSSRNYKTYHLQVAHPITHITTTFIIKPDDPR